MEIFVSLWQKSAMATNRINWIDWAKCIAITMVVFGHIPQTEDSFLQFYICIFHIPLFFFISGYLTKARTDTKEELAKCKKSLIIPYILYNIIFYPYWAIRLYLDKGVDISVYDYIVKPIIGLFFLQIETPISSPVNGAMWFLAVLLIMRITAHICNKTTRPIISMFIVACLFVIIFVLDNFVDLLQSTTIDGLFKCMPLYILGYMTRYYHILDKVSFKSDAIYSIILISISIIGAIINKNTDNPVIRIFAFYEVLITASYGVLFLCKTLNGLSSSIIITISIGTLMIMGLHWMFIGMTNFIIEHIFHMNTGITYTWFEAIVFAIIIDTCIYPIIIFSKKYYPILLGK